MSSTDDRDRVRDSPERARSLLTVRAAISSARSSERPCSSALSLMCSYWRARLVPFLTPRGGISTSFVASALSSPARGREKRPRLPDDRLPCPRRRGGRLVEHLERLRVAAQLREHAGERPGDRQRLPPEPFGEQQLARAGERPGGGVEVALACEPFAERPQRGAALGRVRVADQRERL